MGLIQGSNSLNRFIGFLYKTDKSVQCLGKTGSSLTAGDSAFQQVLQFFVSIPKDVSFFYSEYATSYFF
jgi:hypothetical protein